MTVAGIRTAATPATRAVGSPAPAWRCSRWKSIIATCPFTNATQGPSRSWTANRIRKLPTRGRTLPRVFCFDESLAKTGHLWLEVDPHCAIAYSPPPIGMDADVRRPHGVEGLAAEDRRLLAGR